MQVKKFDELVMPEQIKDIIKKSKRLILFGRPGCGKTEITRRLALDFDREMIFINAATDNGCAMLKDGSLNMHLSSLSRHKGGKMIVFNEASRLTQALQEGLKTIIETNPDVTWVFTTNSMKLDSAIVSRCTLIDFDTFLIDEKTRDDMYTQLATHTMNLLSKKFTQEEILSKIGKSDIYKGLVDMRQWFEQIDFALANDELKQIKIANALEAECFIKMKDFIGDRKHKEAYESIKSVDKNELIEYFDRVAIPELRKNDYYKSIEVERLLNNYERELRKVNPYRLTSVLILDIIKIIHK